MAEGSADETIPSAGEIEAKDSDGPADANQGDGIASSATETGLTATTQLQPTVDRRKHRQRLSTSRAR
jgi:hypothetical protein